MRNKLLTILLIMLLAIGFVLVFNPYFNNNTNVTNVAIKEDGYYTSRDEVALYIHIYQKLPDNYITKKTAVKLGYKASEGNLWDVSNRKSLGGDVFFNREKLLPTNKSRKYMEADIDYKGGYRNSKRIVYSNDGLIYYTDDHYDSFTLLYGDE